MIYDSHVTLRIPEAIRDIANRIAKAFDPDTGGDHTFDCEAIDGYLTVTFPCVYEMAEAMPYFADSPEMLYTSVLKDYEARWAELIPPSLEECIQFCQSLEML